jgi:hypothetical protein
MDSHWFWMVQIVFILGWFIGKFKFMFKLYCDGRSVGQFVLVPGHHLWLTTRFFSTVRHLRFACCGAPSLTRVQSAATLGSKSRRTHDHILLSHLRLPHPGGPRPRIYIPQEQGGPDIPSCTGFPFCRLLRLAGMRWRYSIPPPHRTDLLAP